MVLGRAMDREMAGDQAVAAPGGTMAPVETMDLEMMEDRAGVTVPVETMDLEIAEDRGVATVRVEATVQEMAAARRLLFRSRKQESCCSGGCWGLRAAPGRAKRNRLSPQG